MTIMPKGKKWQSSIAGLDCCSAQPECANRFVQVDAKGPKSRAPAIVIDVAHSCRVRQRYLAGGAHGFQCGLHEVRSFITRNGVGSVQFFSPLSHRIYALHSPHSAVSFLMLQFRLLSIEIVTTSWFGVGGLVREMGSHKCCHCPNVRFNRSVRRSRSSQSSNIRTSSVGRHLSLSPFLGFRTRVRIATREIVDSIGRQDKSLKGFVGPHS